ncbi:MULTISPECIES: YolD-like family protein [unclassified Sporosarcina]|uniref:YolD-like family protein n=1 Tax=unclassified Sporosarcina TaxID=2647733 RepID=UPI001A922100|nr:MULTISPECIES: YolD-like family protein [unclassified Sporosarcina]MBO0588175.1 YolD-like family protein [Sporosarcina sp. E16_8]MBO0601929.1 YolD-like family protein [Sporosarcina sp. E16_3]
MLDNIRDRGTKKWRGLMLTEHVQAVKDWKESDGKVERPQFDEWELESIQLELELAYKRQSEAKVSTWRKGKLITYTGKISVLDHRLSLISIEGPFGDDKIPVVDVIKVQSMD